MWCPHHLWGPFGWGENREDRKWRREKGFWGCLVGVKNWRDFGGAGAQVFSPLAHENAFSPIWRENYADFAATIPVTFLPHSYNIEQVSLFSL